MANIINFVLFFCLLSNQALAQVYAEDITADRLTVDNVRCDGNTISTINSNGNLVFDLNGTGQVEFTDLTASTVPYLDSNKRLASSAVTPTQLGYVDFTSSGQTQINTKAPTNDPTFTGYVTVSGLLASRALVTGGLKELSSATTTAAELDRLSGVNSQVCGISDTCTLTGKTFDVDGAGNALTNITNANIKAAAGIVDTKLDTISTAGKVSNSATTAASANTASAIVARDGSGNFSAGTISAALTGTASGNTTYTPNQYGVVLSGSGNTMTVLAPDASTTKVLTSGGASANPTWETPAAAVQTTKGDLAGYSTTAARVPIGTNGYLLQADSGQTLGLAWVNIGGVTEGTFSIAAWPITANQYGNLTSISLDAGTWLINWHVHLDNTGVTTTSDILIGIGTVTGNDSTGVVSASNAAYLAPVPNASDANFDMDLAGYIVTPGSTTTYYLKGYAGTSITNLRAAGRLTAVRIR